jgi:hypothetical protein
MFSINWYGAKLVAETGPAMKKGARRGVEKVFQESQEQVPFAEGQLCASGSIFEEGDKVGITYSGKHAIPQHERLDFRHPDPTNPKSKSGRKAKYLSDPWDQNQGDITDSIADELKKVIK